MSDDRFVVKVTRPFIVNDLNPTALVCDRDCSVYLYVPMSPEILGLLGDNFKAYVWAELEDDGRMLRILEAAPAQAW